MKVGDWVEFINTDKAPYNDLWCAKNLNKPLQIKAIKDDAKALIFERPVGTIFIEYRGVTLVRPARIELLKALKKHL